MRLLPRRLQLILGSGVGWLLRCVFRFRRHIVDMQLAVIFPELDEREFCELRNGVYQHFGRLLVEILAFPGMKRGHLLKYVEWHGLENLDAALAKGKGVGVLCGHLGSFEVPANALVARGYDFRAIGKKMKSEAGEIFRLMLRDENGVETLPTRGSLRAILKGLRDGAAIIFVQDQNMTSDEGEFVDFFGYPACTMTNLAVIARRTGAAVVPGHSWRDDKGIYHVALLPEVPLPPDASARELTQQFSLIVEGMIREHPEQWLWIHKRWRTRPEGEAENPFTYRKRR
jgi:Kdo2-lipid IVA lauroyltransferase/acyltransferase